MQAEMNQDKALERLVEAALPHVAFEGWSPATLAEAIADSGLAPGLAHALVPRGGLDLALAYHRMGDARMGTALAARDLSALRFRERVALAVRLRLEGADREVVRRGSTLLALPQNAALGAQAIWGTADAIWTALGDSAQDASWYTKRATLSAVYAATVLYWLGDDSEGHEASWAFLDRRIANVMSFEKLKAGLRENPLGKALLAGPLRLMETIRPPQRAEGLPGRSLSPLNSLKGL